MTADAPLIGAVETGGTKIVAALMAPDGEAVAEARWPTGSADEAAAALIDFFRRSAAPGRLAAVGIAAFGPLDLDPHSPDHGMMLATTKPGWAGRNLKRALGEALSVPVAVDTDVNAAAIAEQADGAGRGLRALAYVTVGTGIGAGLAIEGRTLKGGLHPEVGHLRVARRADDAMASVCPFHADCAEGLAAGPAVQRRLPPGRTLSEASGTFELSADYLAQVARILVLTWAPDRIVWGGGVMTTPGLVDEIHRRLIANLNEYGATGVVARPGYCTPAALEHAGRSGAAIIARELARSSRV